MAHIKNSFQKDKEMPFYSVTGFKGNCPGYLSHVMNVATPAKDCLELIYQLLVPVIMTRGDKRLTRQEVSILLLQKCEPPVLACAVNDEPPVLACAVNEAIASIAGENSSSMPTLIIPFLLPEAKLKLDDKILLENVNAKLHGIQIGSDTAGFAQQDSEATIFIAN